MFSYVVLEGLGKAPVNKSGLIELFDLIKYVDARVPELSYQVFKRRQNPKTKFAGSNFPLVKPVTVLADTGTTIPAKSTHVVIAPTTVRQTADDKAPAVVELAPGTQVRLVETAGGWVLITRDGKRLGYVEAAKALAPLQ